MKKSIKRVLSVLLTCLLTAALLLPALADAGENEYDILRSGEFEIIAIMEDRIGDVDNDGSVTASDARLALRAAVGLEKYAAGSVRFTEADVDFDGSLTASDARLILRSAVGLENLFVKNPMHMAMAKNGDVYMEAPMDGTTVGILVRTETGLFGKTQKMYMINHDAKTYTDASVISTIIPDFNLSDLTGAIQENGFTDLPALSDATSVTDGAFEATPCKVYSFLNEETGAETRIYMNGNKLLAMEQLQNGSRVSVMRFTSVSRSFPAFPPAGYAKQDILKFMAAMEP